MGTDSPRFIKNKIAIVLGFASVALAGVTAGAFFAFTHDLPQIRSLETFKPSAVTRIYSRDRVLLDELFLERRDPVPLADIPFYLKTALIATEDRKFSTHSGVDLKGILRAIVKDIMAGEYVEGASTITQQLAKTLFLSPRKTLVRKIREAILAFQLERRYTKDEILELYLNQVYFGSGAYGVESAAKLFFGKRAKDLNLAECAMVAGMPKAPSRYSPLVDKELAIKRRNTVLMQMRDTGIITESVYRQTQKKLYNPGMRNRKSTEAPYFAEYVTKFLEKEIGSSLLYKGGLTVFTTLSFKLQKTAEMAVEKGLVTLQKRMEKKFQNPSPQGALVAIGAQTGEILSMVGGKDYYESPFNRATDAYRQPGSAFKPIVYAHAIERGFPQNMIILDAPVVFKGGLDGKDWRPENFSQKYMGEMTLRMALSISENIPAIRLVEKLGSSTVVRFAHTLGIESTLYPNLSLALGTSEITLLELTAAYAVFPNRGQHIKPYGVMEVLDPQGKDIWRIKPKKRITMSREGAAIITNMLQGVINEGTGRKARSLKLPVAGKTGTTDACRDALFVGFSPSIAAGVWVGNDGFTTLGKRETGARAALPIWMEFMAKASADAPYTYFDIPDNVVQKWIDPLTGRFLEEASPKGVLALLLKEKTVGQ